jgi:hypothetical protein
MKMKFQYTLIPILLLFGITYSNESSNDHLEIKNLTFIEYEKETPNLDSDLQNVYFIFLII